MAKAACRTSARCRSRFLPASTTAIASAWRARAKPGPTGAPPGDLYVEVRVREHAIFQRDGDDLHCEVPIRFRQAALGAEISVPTLEGEAEITIPAETQTGKLFRLRGKGVKSVRSGRTGDLLCHVVVETPVKLTREQRELLQQFEATFKGETRAGIRRCRQLASMA